MQQQVRVLSNNPDGSAQVVCVRQSACSGDCHKCSGCGAVEQAMIFNVRNPIGAKAGDIVNVESATGPVLKAAAVLYMLPLLLFIAGYLVGMQWQLAGIAGGLAFVLGIGIAVAYDRLVMKKKNTEYTIIGFVRKA